jgi:hypothetical protein
LFHDAEQPIDPAEMEPTPVAERKTLASRRRGSENVMYLVIGVENQCADVTLLNPRMGR